jgi:hypothetical protein
MIIKGRKEIIEYYYGKQPIIEIYRENKLLWELVRSCFGKGYWISNLPWISDDIWRNN